MNKQYWFDVKEFHCSTWAPKVREGASMINHPYSDICYLFGGVCHDPNHGVAKLLIEESEGNVVP